MAKLITPCPICGKPLILKESVKLNSLGKDLNTYTCGHAFVEDLPPVVTEATRKYESVDGSKTARPYQREGIDFILNTGFNCILADEMRLGKTPQAEMALASAYGTRTPALLIVRGANLWQWVNEHKVWCDSLPLGIFPITTSKAFIPPGFSTYIISQDLFARGGKCKTCGHSEKKHSDEGQCTFTSPDGKLCRCEEYIEHNNIVDTLLTFGFKVCIVDEAHFFKNTNSKRAKALTRFLLELSKENISYDIPFTCMICKHQWTENVTKLTNEQRINVHKSAYCPSCNAYNAVIAQKEVIRKERKCGCVMLTGTAIENSAMEYFFPLNIVAPEIAHSKEHFKRTWLTDDGKRVKSWRLAEFRDMLKPYVLRREKGDVFTDLPELNRIFTVMKVENEALKKLYNDKLDEIEARSVSFTTFDGLGELAILRQIAALAKVDWAAEYLSEALDEDTTTKYAVGMHHHSVFNTLKYKLDTMNIGAVRFSGSESAEEKYRIEKNFAHNMKERVLIINMLAGGVGCDFHETPNVIALERQWNGAKESQFEHRFYNPDRKIMGNNNTTIEYVLAQGTIDEWWHNMVESKRKIFGETISNEWNIETDTVSFRSLLDQTIAGRLR